MTAHKFGDLAVELHLNGYSPIPVKPNSKKCVVKGWEKRHVADPGEIEAWCRSKPGHGVGLVCARVVAVDIDIYDPDIAEECGRMVVAFSDGTPPVRFGQRPKRLFLFRCEGEHFRKKVTPGFHIGDRSDNKVEILAKGQMFVAFGIHPHTRQPFDWPETSPTDIKLDDLPALSERSAGNLLTELATLIKESGGTDTGHASRHDAIGHRRPKTAKQQEGRNGYLFSRACSMRKSGMGENEMREAISALNRLADSQNCPNFSHGSLPDEEVSAICKSAMSERYAPVREGSADRPYFSSDGRLWRHENTTRGRRDIVLSNFTAEILEDICRDDGAGEVREYQVKGRLCSGEALMTAAIPAGRFNAMGWVADAWGARASIKVGAANHQHAGAAIQYISRPEQRRIYTHTGWRRVGDAWHFLHGAGAITAHGFVPDVEVELGRGLKDYELPDPESGDIKEAVRISLDLLNVALEPVTWPLLAAAYRSVLAEWLPAELSVFVVGPTGTFKTCLAALCVAHFGKGWSGTNTPTSWSSTPNALERMAFTTKDHVLLIDDFAPNGTYTDIRKLHATAERIIRAQGNQSGRFRMRADSSLAGSLPPRGLIVATGEDTPKGQSLQARLVLIQVAPTDVCVSGLSEAQASAENGTYALAMAAFVKHLSQQADNGGLSHRLEARRKQLRAEAISGAHTRMPDNIASLMVGAEELLDFSVAAGAITDSEMGDLRVRAWGALNEQAKVQMSLVSGTDPASRFVSLTAAVVSAKRANIAATDGGPPNNATALGWDCRASGEHLNTVPNGPVIGWIKEDDLYLEAEVATASAKRLAHEQGNELGFSDRRIHKALDEAGLLKSSEPGRHTVRKRLDRRRRYVLHMSAKTVLGIEAPPIVAPPIPPPQFDEEMPF